MRRRSSRRWQWSRAQDRDDRLVAALSEDAGLLADESYTEWALRPRERLEALRQKARLTLARDRTRGAGHSRPEAVVAAWESCLGHDPACEEAAAALMRAYSAQGQRNSWYAPTSAAALPSKNWAW